MDIREELNKTVSEMNRILKDIIKVADMSNKEEESKILILSQLLNKTEKLIDTIESPRRDFDEILDEQRRWTLIEVEGRLNRLEQDIYDRIQYLLERERNTNGL